MKASAMTRLVAVALALALAAAAAPFWFARDRPWMRPEDLPSIALLAGGPFLVVALLAGVLAARERKLTAAAVGCRLRVLIGMLVGCGCWLLWVLLITTAQYWF